MRRCRFEEAKPLWGFDGLAVGREGTDRAMDRRRTSRRCGMAMLRSLDSGRRHRSRRHVSGRVTQSRPLSVAAAEERTHREATDAGDHAAARKVGGARIGWPRAKVSTMIIAAPQCGQTKVGWTLARRRSRRAVQSRWGRRAAVRAHGRDARGVRHWRAARSGECGESRGQNVQQEAADELVDSRASWSCGASCRWRGNPSSGR